eukprot:TRINITY_DN3938_c0_g2_i1.p1 TRINITY_DN3938_c0_g2~~TRINITY_DN3938_c0_g2_i1.p1  ORF type:complete len:320 (+),score=97.85 TRINITY_DN3938_c0_g2_i1:139-1098(+)
MAAAAADNIYVSGLPEGVDEEAFKSIFSGFGSIVSSKVFTDRKYGFVRYETAEQATAAIDSMNGKDYKGSELVVKLSEPRQRYDWGMWGGGKGAVSPADVPPSDNLYMKGLPKGMSEDKIREIFNAYGAVGQVRVLNTGASEDTVALVRMEALDKATWIVQNLNGNIPQGLENAIFVKYADSSQIKWQKQAHKSMQHWQEWGWLWASLSKGGKGYGWGGWGGKGKGKGGRRPRGPDLPRESVSDDVVTGEVLEWKGKYGWIKPAVAIDHAAASKNEGKIFISMSDLLPEGVTELAAGTTVKFKVFSDSAGLGAQECMAA